MHGKDTEQNGNLTPPRTPEEEEQARRAGLFCAPRLPRFGVPGALALIALGAVLLAAAVAWLPHGFLPEAAPDSLPPKPELEEEVYPRKAFEIVVAGAAALMHGVLVLIWNLWGRGNHETG